MSTLTISAPVLVTGGASGIGRAVTDALLDEDVPVAAVDIDAGALQGMSAPKLFTQVCDVRDAAAVDAAAGAAWSHFGRLGGLVNCAGIYPVTPFLELEVEEWDQVLAVNLRAPFLMTRAVARRMVSAGMGGAVVNVTSTAATLCRPGVAHYGASKAGLSQLTRDMALELAPHSIRVNAVAPGLIATDRVMSHARGAGAAEHRAKLERIPLGREGTPSELVPFVLTLLAEQSSYCTGSIVLVDGGVTLGIPAY